MSDTCPATMRTLPIDGIRYYVDERNTGVPEVWVHKTPQTMRRRLRAMEVSVTFDVTTEESAEAGDFAASGYETEPDLLTLRDALDIVRQYAPYDLPADIARLPSWGGLTRVSLYQSDGSTDDRTGDVTRYCVHVQGTRQNMTRLLAFCRVELKP